jgi:tetratricopeptide (TPR) repeat protein
MARLTGAAHHWKVRRKQKAEPLVNTGNGEAPAVNATSKTTWFSTVKWVVIVPVALAAGLVVKQWFDAPIAIETLIVDSNASALGVAGDAIADQIKAYISEINSESGELFQGRKLGEATVPLDVKIGDWDVTVEKITKSFKIPLTSARVTGHLSVVDQCVILEAATSQGDSVKVDIFRMNAPQGGNSKGMEVHCKDTSGREPSSQARETTRDPLSGNPTAPLKHTSKSAFFMDDMKGSIRCLALRVVVMVSPDVAANYLFKRAEREETRLPERDIALQCDVNDDVMLYSQVAQDVNRGPAERANALVGLSLEYSRSHQVYEELNMARAATDLLSHAKQCAEWLPDSHWRRFQCRVQRYWSSDGYRRAEIAAWMQLGESYSDYAALVTDKTTQNIRRSDAIVAYQHVISIKPDYALAYDAIGLQEDWRGNVAAARDAFHGSLSAGETPAAHYDLGWLYINRHNYFVGQHYWEEAEEHFKAAIRLKPDYWDAHRSLGFVLFENEKYRQAIDVLKPAVDHETSDGDLYRHLGSAYAGICQFEKARQNFKAAYAVYARTKLMLAGLSTISDEAKWQEAIDNEFNTLTDWGKVLYQFGLGGAAIAQEEAVVKGYPSHIYAHESLGQFQIKSRDKHVQALGIGELKRAFDSDREKHDFVLANYLNGLTDTEHPDQAIVLYEKWGREGFVPKPSSTAVPNDTNQSVRLSYAIALRANGQWKNAINEFKVLDGLNIEFTKKAIGNLETLAMSGGANSEQIADVETLVAHAVPDYDTHLCPNRNIPESTPPMPESTSLSQVSIQ